MACRTRPAREPRFGAADPVRSRGRRYSPDGRRSKRPRASATPTCSRGRSRVDRASTLPCRPRSDYSDRGGFVFLAGTRPPGSRLRGGAYMTYGTAPPATPARNRDSNEWREVSASGTADAPAPSVANPRRTSLPRLRFGLPAVVFGLAVLALW